MIGFCDDWQQGIYLDKYEKSKIIRRVRVHQIFWTAFWFSLFFSFVYWAVSSVINNFSEASVLFLISVIVYLMSSICMFRSDYFRIKRLNADYFEWTYANVTSVRYVGGRHRRSMVYTDKGVFAPGHSVFRFKTGMQVVIVKYKVEYDPKNLGENLTFLFDPRAYIR